MIHRPLVAAFILAPYAFNDVYGRDFIVQLAKGGIVVHGPITAEEMLENPPEWLGEIDVLFTGWEAPVFTEALLEKMPELRAVFYGAGSIRRVTTDAFWDRNITITTGVAANAVPVAEYTLAAILFSLKRVWHFSREVNRGCSFPPTAAQLPGAFDSLVGLVSMGYVGRLVRERLRPFDLRVAVHDPFISPEILGELSAIPLELDEMFTQCDVVSLHTPLIPATTGMITGELLSRMKPGATFINTGRGALVKEEEMCEVLRQRPDLQAVLDVTYPDPPEINSPLRSLPNVFLTPHIAGSVGPECRRIGRMMMEEFQRFRTGQPLLHSVCREVAATRA